MSVSPNVTSLAPDHAADDAAAVGVLDLTVIMPVYNEVANIERVLREAFETFDAVAMRYEVLVVDDGSSDGSVAVIERMVERRPDVLRVLRHSENRGIAAAFRTLDAAARGKHIFLIGSDGQWRMAEALRMFELRDRYDLVIGRRQAKHYSLTRKFVSGAYNLLPVLLFGVRTHDAGSIKLYRRELGRMPLVSRGVFDEAERIIRAKKRGYRVGAIDVEHLPRKSGRSSVRLSLVYQALLDLARCWWSIMILRRK